MIMGFLLLCAGLLFCFAVNDYIEAKMIEIEIGEINYDRL